jgi:hypothetical protein
VATDTAIVRLPELHDRETGRLDARSVAAYLNVPLTRLAAALGKKYQTVYKTPAAPALQEGLTAIETILNVLARVIGDRPTILAWLNSPHPDLGMRTPMQVMLDGHADAVEGMLMNAVWGIPS